VGTPAVSELTLAPGAGHGDEGDSSFQGPAQEQLNEPLPVQPKPTNAEEPTNFDAETNSGGAVIALAARSNKPKATAPTAVVREAGGLVTTRPKPEKRKNAKERAKAKFAKKNGAKDDAKDDAKDGTTPMTAKAKSEAESKAKAKAANKAASKAAKAERKAKRTAARAA